MLVIILNRIRFRIAGTLVLVFLTVALTSCATKDTALISDPQSSRENALPWNEQQKWEREGEAAALNQQRR